MRLILSKAEVRKLFGELPFSALKTQIIYCKNKFSIVKNFYRKYFRCGEGGGGAILNNYQFSNMNIYQLQQLISRFTGQNDTFFY